MTMSLFNISFPSGYFLRSTCAEKVLLMSTSRQKGDDDTTLASTDQDREGFKPVTAQRSSSPSDFDAIRRGSNDYGQYQDDSANVNHEGDFSVGVESSKLVEVDDKQAAAEGFIPLSDQQSMSRAELEQLARQED